MTISITLSTVGDLSNTTTAQTTINNNSNSITTAFGSALSTKGDTMLGTLNMNSNQIINLPAPSTSNSPARLVDVQNIAAGNVTNLTITLGTTQMVSGNTYTTIAGGIAFTGNLTLSGSNTYSGTATFSNTVNHTGTFEISGNAMTFPASAATLAGLSIAQTWTNTQTYGSNAIRIQGSSSGYTAIVNGNAGSSNYTLTLPAVTDTVATIGTTQSWTAAQDFLVGTQIGNLTFPAVTGAAVTTADTGTVTGTMIATNTVALSNVAQQTGYTLIGNTTGSTGNLSAFNISGLTNKTAPASTDLVMIVDQEASGQLKYSTLGALTTSVVAGVASLNTLTGVLTLTSNGRTTVTSSGTNIAIAEGGGSLNKFRNPGFNVAQRGTSGTVTAGSTGYTLDGWRVSPTGANGAWAQEYNANMSGNSLRLSCATGMTIINLAQRIESYIASQFLTAAKTAQSITVQWTIYNNTGSNFTPQVASNYAASQDSFGTVTNDLTATNLTNCPNATLTTVSYTFTPSVNCANGYTLVLGFGAALNAASGYVDIGLADVRVTPGLSTGINTPPPVELRPSSTELASCQRYFFQTPTAQATIGTAACVGTTIFYVMIGLPTQMRALPSLTSSATTALKINAATLLFTSSAISIVNNSTQFPTLTVTVSGATAGWAGQAFLNASSDYLQFNAEL